MLVTLSVEYISQYVRFQQRCHFRTAARRMLFLELSYYIRNDLPKAVKHKAPRISFADDTNILITSPYSNQLQSDLICFCTTK